jgi:hypothetical protein
VITPSTATLIGTSAVSLVPGETKDVLCVTPWVPDFVNNGHECLIAQAFAPPDTAPPQGPNDPFDVPGDRHAAQRNVVVGAGTANARIVHPFLVRNDVRFRADHVVVRVRRGEIGLLKAIHRTLAFERMPEEAGELKDFGLQVYRCGDEIAGVGQQEVQVPLAPGRRQGLALVVRPPEQFADGTAALFLIEQLAGGKPVGGLAFVAVPAAPCAQKPHRS